MQRVWCCSKGVGKCLEIIWIRCNLFNLIILFFFWRENKVNYLRNIYFIYQKDTHMHTKIHMKVKINTRQIYIYIVGKKNKFSMFAFKYRHAERDTYWTEWTTDKFKYPYCQPHSHTRRAFLEHLFLIFITFIGLLLVMGMSCVFWIFIIAKILFVIWILISDSF